ncbi:hypothetical protein CC78DRAFT_575077 [Lojkania enalia]|uniref:AA9 family lytic polysaccharide monooxygenase n=1 Tax=Lojkania enalia TaxID=147567 RepID=A0A9P4TPB8_9PLEO|nr:hypothetical protein CC78DRAFT_575077 [Didymosphaeria enalia]
MIKVGPKDGASEDVAIVYPNTEPNSLDLRCSRNATLDWSGTKTATIKAGDKVGFAVREPHITGDLTSIYHPDFASAWLSKSPLDDLSRYTRDGNWFKILQVVSRMERSLDFTKPDYSSLYDPAKAIWGTLNVDSASLSPYSIFIIPLCGYA